MSSLRFYFYILFQTGSFHTFNFFRTSYFSCPGNAGSAGGLNRVDELFISICVKFVNHSFNYTQTLKILYEMLKMHGWIRFAQILKEKKTLDLSWNVGEKWRGGLKCHCVNPVLHHPQMFAGVSLSALLKCDHVPHDDDESSGFISAVLFQDQ